MAERVRITGGNIGQFNNEGRDAQVDVNGNLHVREGVYDYNYKVYEDSSFVSGDSPQTHNFYSDTGRTSVDGYIICDGDGDIQVDISRDGLTYQDKFTMKRKEIFNLERIPVNKLRITHAGTDSAYRIFII